MRRIAALAAMVEVDGIAAAPTTTLDFVWPFGSQAPRLPVRLPSDDPTATGKPLNSRDAGI